MRPRVLLAGNWAWDIYEEALARGFEGNGWDVLPFHTRDVVGMPSESSLVGRLRLAWALKPVNESLLRLAHEAKPDLIFLWRCIDILPQTVRSLRSILPGATIVVYHNDNPFASFKFRFKCRHFLASLRYADVAAVYRPADLSRAKTLGALRTELLMPSFIRALHRPLDYKDKSDVIYVGHFEADGREQCLMALNDAGIDVQVRGTQWKSMQLKHPWLARQTIRQLWGDEYVGALSNSKISLAFLSARHDDVYTRRCFEIPACGSLLLAPRTRELQDLFHEDSEAVFWSTKEELVEKVIYLLAHDDIRIRIAAAGRARVISDGHDEYGRARQIIEWHLSRQRVIRSDNNNSG
jgi:spore maturation protein CgeB